MFNSLNNWQKLNILLVVAFMAGSGMFLFFSKPAVTGHVSAVYSIKDMEVIVMKDQVYNLASKDGNPLALDSVMMSGKVVGNGSVKVYIRDNGNRYLVYSNEEKKSSLSAITGYMIKETGQPQITDNIDFVPVEQDILPDFDEDERDLYAEELSAYMGLLEEEAKQDKNEIFKDFVENAEGVEFRGECKDTCALFGLNSTKYTFEFDIDPGTVLYVTEIIYSVKGN
jgi:hypothetical protein